MAAYSKGRWRQVAAAFAAAFVLLNLPLFSFGVTVRMVQMLESGGALTLPFPYSWIPVVAVALLTVVDWRLVREALGPKRALQGEGGSGPLATS